MIWNSAFLDFDTGILLEHRDNTVPRNIFGTAEDVPGVIVRCCISESQEMEVKDGTESMHALLIIYKLLRSKVLVLDDAPPSAQHAGY